MKSLVQVESVSADRAVFTATLFSGWPRTPVEISVMAVPAELREAIAPGALFVASVHRADDEPAGGACQRSRLPDGCPTA
jgi:hypothetical protein